MNNLRLKKILGIIVFCSGFFYLYSFVSNLFGGRKVVILMYHRVADSKKEELFDCNMISSSKKNFEEQVRHLSSFFNVISFNDLLSYWRNEQHIPKKSVIITFDDGYKDNYSCAYPILKKYRLPATIFLATGHIGNNKLFWWDKIAYVVKKSKIKEFKLKGFGACSLMDRNKAIKSLQRYAKKLEETQKVKFIDQLQKMTKVRTPNAKNLFLSWSNVREMSKNGIYFGAHSVSHPILTRISLKQAKHEIINSKEKIERETANQVKVFAYPNGALGDMSDDIGKFLKQSGFSFALSTIYGVNKLCIDPFRLKRIGIEHDDDMRLFRIKLLGIGKSIASFLK